jgi:hypothetical protein
VTSWFRWMTTDSVGQQRALIFSNGQNGLWRNSLCWRKVWHYASYNIIRDQCKLESAFLSVNFHCIYLHWISWFPESPCIMTFNHTAILIFSSNTQTQKYVMHIFQAWLWNISVHNSTTLAEILPYLHIKMKDKYRIQTVGSLVPVLYLIQKCHSWCCLFFKPWFHNRNQDSAISGINVAASPEVCTHNNFHIMDDCGNVHWTELPQETPVLGSCEYIHAYS